MKAILILFNGEFLSASHKADLIGTVANMIPKVTNIEGANCLQIADFDDADIAKILVAYAANDSKVKSSVVIPTEDALYKFCNEIRTVIGNPESFSNESTFKMAFVKGILTDEQIRAHNTEILRLLLSSKKMPRDITQVLASQNMENIPQYLKEINSILNLF